MTAEASSILIVDDEELNREGLARRLQGHGYAVTVARSGREAIEQTLTAAQQNATRGVAETLQGYEYLMVLMSHAEDSIPVDVDRPVGAQPAPFVSNDSAFSFVSGLLDAADAHLAAGGSALPFALPPGFAGFDDVPVAGVSGAQQSRQPLSHA